MLKSGIRAFDFIFLGLVAGLWSLLGGTLAVASLSGADDSVRVAIAVCGLGGIARVGDADSCADSGRSANLARFWAAIVSFSEGLGFGIVVVLRARRGAFTVLMVVKSTVILVWSGFDESLSNRACCFASSEFRILLELVCCECSNAKSLTSLPGLARIANKPNKWRAYSPSRQDWDQQVPA